MQIPKPLKNIMLNQRVYPAVKMVLYEQAEEDGLTLTKLHLKLYELYIPNFKKRVRRYMGYAQEPKQ